MPVRAQRRGSALLWSVAALGLAIALAPLYVSLCGSLAALSVRGAHRLTAIQRGEAELERLRAASAAELRPREFTVPELPQGRGFVAVGSAGPGMKRIDLLITWDEHGHAGRASWTTLVSDRETRRH